MKASRKLDAGIILVLLLIPLLWFAPQVFGGKTLLPADNLYAFEPWRSAAAQVGVEVPHNSLISDLIRENYQWKSFIGEQLAARDPGGLFWNPRVFAGVPFLAAGQHSALYPLSVLFYVLPLWLAYGVFTWLQIGLAAASMYVFARVLGQRRLPAVIAAIAYAFSGFFITSVNFTMVIAAAAWLPLILATIELIVRKQEQKGSTAYSPVPYVVAGSALLALQVLAGHVEITYYVLMVSAFYACWRLFGMWRRLGSWRPLLRIALWLLVMVILGLGMGGVQLVPLYELVSQSFRQGSASLQQVRDWAWPSRQIVTFLLPDAFGNPTHHTYFDIWRRIWVPVTQNALGEPIDTIFWGVKNYVEGSNYLGLTTLALAVLATLGAIAAFFRRHGSVRQPSGEPWMRPPTGRFYAAGFALLAVLSLLFAFGTPLYGVLYYLVPGYSQLHSAFRWVFPYTLSMAILAGFGADWLTARHAWIGVRRLARPLGWLLLGGGLAVLLVVGASLVLPAPFVALGDRLLVQSNLAREFAFSDGVMAWSYEATGIARFGAMALLTGAALLWASLSRKRTDAGDTVVEAGRPSRLSNGPAVALALVLLLDLWLAGHDFNPAVDPALLKYEPPVLSWLQAHRDAAQPWRFTTFDAPNEKTLNPNTAMVYGLEDVRGYDSIIPRQYVTYMERIQPQGDLLYNVVGPIYTTINGQPNYAALDSRLLDLLGVKYVLTTHTIPNAGFEQVYDGEVRVYENSDVLPRVFIVPQAISAPDQTAALDLLEQVDPAQTVVLEGIAPDVLPALSSPALREAHISQRSNREVFVDVNVSDRGWLVFADNYFDGWKAYIRPFGVQGEGVTAEGESNEQQLPIYRADGTFRAVYIDQAGQWTIRFVYSPRSTLLGIYTSFLAAITLLLLAGWWTWGRYYRGEGSEVGTVAKNSAVQMVMSLLSKGIDFAFAMLRLRVLSPAGEGSYAFAIAFYGFFEIVTRFGLGTLLTRDVALDRQKSRRYLVNVMGLRVGLWALSLPVMLVVAIFYRQVLGQLTTAEAQAIAIFAGALLFANVADAISSVFNAHEKMEYPAGIATATAVAKVALGALVLLPPLDLGFVGLAGVSLVMNVLQAAWLYIVLEQKVLGAERRPREARASFDWALQRHMVAESGPLMLNNLLASVFWRIDLWVLKAFLGATAVGIFSAGVKYLDGLNVIPSYFTLAIFPLMSRYAQAGKDSLAKAYRLSSQLLLMVALPVAVFVTFAAEPLIQILGGAAFLPDSAVALRIMIWSIPIGFVNSVTQYVLIAVNQQRFLTKAFLIGVVFNTLANIILVPRLGYVAAAIVLIPAEISLFIPFSWAIRKYVTAAPLGTLFGRPIAATAANIATVWALQRIGVPLLLAIGAGFVVYLALLCILGAFRGDDFAVIRDRLARFLPASRRSA